MPVAHHKLNTLAGEASENLALPAINGDTRNHDKGVNFASEPDVVMITKTENNPRSAKRIIYRSIPPSVQNFTLSDMLDPGPTPKQRVKKKSGHLSGNAPSDFARRFFSRPTTQPKVIEFTTGDASPELKRRGVNGFFPPVKLRVSHKGQHSASSAEEPEHYVLEAPDEDRMPALPHSAPLFLSRVIRSGTDKSRVTAELAERIQSADKVLKPLPQQAMSDSDVHVLCDLCKLVNTLTEEKYSNNACMNTRCTTKKNPDDDKSKDEEMSANKSKTLTKTIFPIRHNQRPNVCSDDVLSNIHGDKCVLSTQSDKDKSKSAKTRRHRDSSHPAAYDDAFSMPSKKNIATGQQWSDNIDPDEHEVATTKIFLTESKRTQLHVTLCTATQDTSDTLTQESATETPNVDKSSEIHEPVDNSNITSDVADNPDNADLVPNGNGKIDASTQTKETLKIPTNSAKNVEQTTTPRVKGSAKTTKRRRKTKPPETDTDSLKKRKHAYSAGLKKRELVFNDATIYMLVPTIRNEFTFMRSHYPLLQDPPHSPSRMQFAPTAYSEVRPRSSISRSSRHSTLHMRKTPESIRTAPPMDNVTIYPETFDCGDLSYLPPPKRILPKREVPWVFRYKVKRNMNELSRIMASRPAQLVEA